MMYVTLDMAKDHLEVDHDERDDLITAYIEAASSAVKNYLKSASAYEPARDEDDNPLPDPVDPEDREVRYEVRAAVLLMVGYLFRNRDENPENAFVRGYLPAPVTALLYPLRDPALC